MLIPGTDSNIAGIIAIPIANADINAEAIAIPTAVHFPMMSSQMPAIIPPDMFRNIIGMDKALIKLMLSPPF
jgi:hypothetical protein